MNLLYLQVGISAGTLKTQYVIRYLGSKYPKYAPQLFVATFSKRKTYKNQDYKWKVWGLRPELGLAQSWFTWQVILQAVCVTTDKVALKWRYSHDGPGNMTGKMFCRWYLLCNQLCGWDGFRLRLSNPSGRGAGPLCRSALSATCSMCWLLVAGVEGTLPAVCRVHVECLLHPACQAYL